ncbi:MAG TPA: hypothetical protein VKW06_06780 [Candidatus Angelobacter sp.]|nr:hypothetical protein [Candidatus Angelobacter sp.]
MKIERAKEHIRNLDATIQAFLSDKPYRIGAKPHSIPSLEHTTLYVAEVKPVPDNISLILGDAIHNLRSALDHLAWQLVELGGGKPDKNTYFPICERPHQYASMMGNREIQKIPKDARDILEAIQPYNTMDMTLWLLHQLDISDKHRLLLTVVTSMDKWGVDFALGQTLWFNEHRFLPLVVGYEIINIPTSTYHRQPHHNFQLGVDIAFGESEIPEGELVIYTLKKMVDFVEGFVSKFDRFLI